MSKELITKEEAEVLNQDSVEVLRHIRSGPMTYKELARKTFKNTNVFTMSHTYAVVAQLRKTLGLPFYPFNGPNSVIKLPRTKTDAEGLVNYVGRRAVGMVKSYVRTLKYVDKHVPEARKVVDQAVKQLEDNIVLK